MTSYGRRPRRDPVKAHLCLLVVAGALSAALAGCARGPLPLVFPEVEIGDPSFAPTFEAYTAAPIRWGNRVDLLLNGEQIFPAQLEAIRSAQSTFTYAQYFYETGPPARALVKAMSERCRAGVRGHVLVDGIGSLGMPAELRDSLTEAGCEVASFHPVEVPTIGEINNRNHRRILVVDGRIGFTGSSGASSKWMGNGRREGYWRQTDVRIEGHAVTDLQAAFAENWLEATGRALGGADYFPRQERAGEVLAQIVKSSPERGRAVTCHFARARPSASAPPSRPKPTITTLGLAAACLSAHRARAGFLARAARRGFTRKAYSRIPSPQTGRG